MKEKNRRTNYTIQKESIKSIESIKLNQENKIKSNQIKPIKSN